MPMSTPPPALRGREARRDSEYELRGTGNVFCAVEPKAGRHFGFATPDRSAFEFARVACHLALQYADAETIHLVLDNLNIHCRKSLTDVFGVEIGSEIWDRFTVHFTPTHGSWLHQAEIEIGLFPRQCLGTRRIPDLQTLRRESRAWTRRMNHAHQDQLEVRPQSRPQEVRLQREIFHAVRDLSADMQRATTASGPAQQYVTYYLTFAIGIEKVVTAAI